MKIGLVRFLNARPLDDGFRRNLPLAGVESYEWLEDTPARLYEMLLGGELDAALISSAEVLRHPEALSYCPSVGVCARSEVRSILYIRKKNGKKDTPLFYTEEPERIYTDNGSRTSVALLRILLSRRFGKHFPAEPTPPNRVPELAQGGATGLLIGDSAMNFLLDPESEKYDKLDLCSWWHREENLPFVFALWAYPRERPLPDAIFEQSFEAGLGNLEEIVRGSPYPKVREYLSSVLHYRLDSRDRASLARYDELLRILDQGSVQASESDRGSASA